MRAVVIAGLVLLWSGVAAASPKVVVTGDDDVGVTEAVREALAAKVEIVDDVTAAWAVVKVTVKKGKGKKKWTAKVAVHQAPDGKRLGGYEVKAAKAKLARQTAAKAWKQLKKPIGKAEPANLDEPVAVAEPVREPEPAPKVEEDVVRRDDDGGAGASASSTALGVSARGEPKAEGDVPWLAVAVEGRPFLRTFRYNDDYADVLRSYDLAAPAVGIDVAWRPKMQGALGHLAVRAGYEQAVGVNGSRTDDGMEFGTSASEWTAGVRADAKVLGWRWALDVNYGEQRFTVDDDAAGDDLVPDTTYRYARGALAVAAPITPKITVEAGGGYRYLLGTGDLGSDAWYPRQTGAGIDADVGASYQVAGPVRLQARVDVRRYFFAMNPEVGDARIVGGAVDQYLAVVGGLSIALQ